MLIALILTILAATTVVCRFLDKAAKAAKDIPELKDEHIVAIVRQELAKMRNDSFSSGISTPTRLNLATWNPPKTAESAIERYLKSLTADQLRDTLAAAESAENFRLCAQVRDELSARLNEK